ncbi:MAG: MarR family transcriptional regulator [Olsenella sp.]
MEQPAEHPETEAPTIDVDDDSAFIGEISRLLSSTFEAIIRLEDCVYRSHGMDLTNSELNLLSTVGRAELAEHRALSMSDVADALGIKRPSATAIVKRLEAKGYIERKRSADDARRIDVTLTRKGECVYRIHAIFNRKMAAEISRGQSTEERRVLLQGISRLEHAYTEAERAAVQAVAQAPFAGRS